MSGFQGVQALLHHSAHVAQASRFGCSKFKGARRCAPIRCVCVNSGPAEVQAAAEAGSCHTHMQRVSLFREKPGRALVPCKP